MAKTSKQYEENYIGICVNFKNNRIAKAKSKIPA